jgi:hypothetical protein
LRPAARSEHVLAFGLDGNQGDAVELVRGEQTAQLRRRTGTLVERHRFPQIKESFYAITPSRRFPNPILRELMKNKRS